MGGCLRAIARRKSELEIAFASERPAPCLGDKRSACPSRPRKLSPQDAAVIRGHSLIQFRPAPRLPRPLGASAPWRPASQQARAVFDAVEQARVEAIGARRMEGVARQPLGAMLEDRFHRGKFDEITDRADAPLEDADRPAWCANG